MRRDKQSVIARPIPDALAASKSRIGDPPQAPDKASPPSPVSTLRSRRYWGFRNRPVVIQVTCGIRAAGVVAETVGSHRRDVFRGSVGRLSCCPGSNCDDARGCRPDPEPKATSSLVSPRPTHRWIGTAHPPLRDGAGHTAALYSMAREPAPDATSDTIQVQSCVRLLLPVLRWSGRSGPPAEPLSSPLRGMTRASAIVGTRRLPLMRKRGRDCSKGYT